jgi:hypothetical protein
VLKIFDVLGRQVATLANEIRMPGSYTVTWDGSDFSSGIYLCRLKVTPIPGVGSDQFIETKKMVLMR